MRKENGNSPREILERIYIEQNEHCIDDPKVVVKKFVKSVGEKTASRYIANTIFEYFGRLVKSENILNWAWQSVTGTTPEQCDPYRDYGFYDYELAKWRGYYTNIHRAEFEKIAREMMYYRAKLYC